MIDDKKFFSQFKFDPAKAGLVGVEREQFVADPIDLSIVPWSKMYLDHLGQIGDFNQGRFHFGYELSACQLESKIGPCRLEDLNLWLNQSDSFLEKIDRSLGLARIHMEVAPENMPLDVYPDPTGRYQAIVKEMPPEILAAACRVAATHIHIGMPDIETAIKCHDRAIAEVSRLASLGDQSSGQRMALYSLMAKRSIPERIGSQEEFLVQARVYGFENDPRSCWTLIRISVHGTLEFRMFGATESTQQITEWARQCHQICSLFLK